MNETQSHAWTVVAVGPTATETFEPFLYTDGLWAGFARPELWCSCLGACGHRVSVKGAHFVMNRMADKIILGELDTGGTYDEEFGEGDVLRFTLGDVDLLGRDRYETFCAPADAPVRPVTWRCCAGKKDTAGTGAGTSDG